MSIKYEGFQSDFRGPMFDGRTKMRATKKMAESVEQAANVLKFAVAQHTPVNTGALKNSILASGGIRITADRTIEGIVGSPLIIAPIIELGRRPGPVSPQGVRGIALWVRRKLKPPRTERAAGRATKKAGKVVLTEAEVTFLVVRKIITQGFAGAAMFEAGIAAADAGVRGVIASGAREWTQEWGGS